MCELSSMSLEYTSIFTSWAASLSLLTTRADIKTLHQSIFSMASLLWCEGYCYHLDFLEIQYFPNTNRQMSQQDRFLPHQMKQKPIVLQAPREVICGNSSYIGEFPIEFLKQNTDLPVRGASSCTLPSTELNGQSFNCPTSLVEIRGALLIPFVPLPTIYTRTSITK